MNLYAKEANRWSEKAVSKKQMNRTGIEPKGKRAKTIQERSGNERHNDKKGKGKRNKRDARIGQCLQELAQHTANQPNDNQAQV